MEKIATWKKANHREMIDKDSVTKAACGGVRPLHQMLQLLNLPDEFASKRICNLKQQNKIRREDRGKAQADLEPWTRHHGQTTGEDDGIHALKTKYASN